MASITHLTDFREKKKSWNDLDIYFFHFRAVDPSVICGTYSTFCHLTSCLYFDGLQKVNGVLKKVKKNMPYMYSYKWAIFSVEKSLPSNVTQLKWESIINRTYEFSLMSTSYSTFLTESNVTLIKFFILLDTAATVISCIPDGGCSTEDYQKAHHYYFRHLSQIQQIHTMASAWIRRLFSSDNKILFIFINGS